MKLYNENSAIGKIREYFAPYFESFGRPVSKLYSWMVIAIIVLGGVPSIRSLYERFLRYHTNKCRNSFYHALSYAKNAKPDGFIHVTVMVALALIPAELRSYGVFLATDDTLIEKFGRKFEHIKFLFDHAAHDGRKHKNAHCFNSLMLTVPIGMDTDGNVEYLAVPLTYIMWHENGRSKLVIARDAILSVKPALEGLRVYLLCDSWYFADTLLGELKRQWPSVQFVSGAKSNTVLYGVTRPAPTGKRGRPKKRERIELKNISLRKNKALNLWIGGQIVFTRVLGELIPVLAIVTANAKDGERRLFISTLDEELERRVLSPDPQNLPGEEETQRLCEDAWLRYVLRWVVEVNYLEEKLYWDLGSYRVRSEKGIMNLVNLITIVYAGMKLLPYSEPMFAHLKGKSPQEIRFEIGTMIQEELFFCSMWNKLKSMKIVRQFLEPLRKAFSLLREAS